MDVIGYLRVSTQEQGRSGLGIAAQRAAIVAAGKGKGWSIQWITDKNHTGSTMDRPGMHTALDALRAGEASAIVVAKLERLSRSLIHFADLMDRALHEGWAIVVLDPPCDMTTAGGRFTAHIFASFAEYERQLIRERTSQALQAKKAQGHRLGRKVRLPTRTRNLIQQRRDNGDSYRTIADELNRRRINTAHGGRRWYGETVRAVCRSLELDEDMQNLRRAG